MRSIRKRLMLILLITTGVVWLSAVIWIQYSTSKEVNHVLDRRLEEASRMVATLIGGDGVTVTMAIHAATAPQKDAEAEPFAVTRQLSCQVWGLDGGLIGDSEGAPRDVLAAGDSGFSENLVGGEIWRVYTLVEPELGFRVMVGDALAMRERLVRDVVIGLLIPLLLALPILTALIWWSVGRGLKPLDRLGRELSSRPGRDMSPLGDAKAPSELRPMIAALNGLFRRVEQARESERSFTAFAAHELKTPLAGLKTQVEIAQIAPDEATRQKALNQLTQSVERTDRMVKQLLELAAVDRASPQTPAPMRDSAQVMEEVVSGLMPLADKHGVTLVSDVPAGLWQTGCAPLLGAALRNLIENAIVASPGGASVEVGLRETAEGMVFSVADRGPGIPEADRPHVTERFFRCATSKGGGSGLGLAIVAAAMNRIGGDLRLAARAGGGECAELVLPREASGGCG